MVDIAPRQQNFPKGFKFHPTDEELVGHYLRHKLLANDASIHDIIPEIDVCKYEPCELPAAVAAISRNKLDGPEWFFFRPRDHKYSKGTRSNRATSRGYWKVTGKDRKIKDHVTNNVIGTKKTLVFYEGRIPGSKTNWVIHEYHDSHFPPIQRTHVLCKLIKKSERKTKDKGPVWLGGGKSRSCKSSQNSSHKLTSYIVNHVGKTASTVNPNRHKMDDSIYDESQPNDRCIAPYEYENLANGYMIPEVHYFSYMADSMMTQTTPESDDFGDSMIQTPPNEVDSMMPELEEFDFRSFLLSSPSGDDE